MTPTYSYLSFRADQRGALQGSPGVVQLAPQLLAELLLLLWQRVGVFDK